MMSIGKSRAKIYVEKETGVTFADIAGVEEASVFNLLMGALEAGMPRDQSSFPLVTSMHRRNRFEPSAEAD